MEAKGKLIYDLVFAGKSTKGISIILNIHKSTVIYVTKLYKDARGVRKWSEYLRKSV
jgi:hypothetical protein